MDIKYLLVIIPCFPAAALAAYYYKYLDDRDMNFIIMISILLMVMVVGCLMMAGKLTLPGMSGIK